MNCVKRLGERVMFRTFERQVNELHIRIAILNRLTELGRPQTVAAACPAALVRHGSAGSRNLCPHGVSLAACVLYLARPQPQGLHPCTYQTSWSRACWHH